MATIARVLRLPQQLPLQPQITIVAAAIHWTAKNQIRRHTNVCQKCHPMDVCVCVLLVQLQLLLQPWLTAVKRHHRVVRRKQIRRKPLWQTIPRHSTHPKGMEVLQLPPPLRLPVARGGAGIHNFAVTKNPPPLHPPMARGGAEVHHIAVTKPETSLWPLRQGVVMHSVGNAGVGTPLVLLPVLLIFIICDMIM